MVRCPTKLDLHGEPTTASRGFTRCGMRLDHVAAPRASDEDLAAHTTLVKVAVAALREADHPTTERRAARAQATARDVATAITAAMKHDPPYPIRPETDTLLRDAVRSAIHPLGTDDNGRGHQQADPSHGVAQALPAQRGIPAVMRTDQQGATRLLGVLYGLGTQHRDKDVTVTELGDTLLFTDLNGTLLMEHTRPALGVSSVGARRGRNPEDDATRVPKVFRLTSHGAVRLGGVRYQVGDRHRGQNVRVVETTDGTILFTDLDGNTLIEHSRPVRGVTRVFCSDGRRPFDDARREPQVFRTTKVGTLTLAGVAYKIGGRYGDQDVSVHEADDGQIVIADLDGNILIEHRRPTGGITYVGRGGHDYIKIGEPRHVRVSSLGQVSHRSKKYWVGPDTTGQEVTVTETDDGRIIVAALDGTILVKHTLAEPGTTYVGANRLPRDRPRHRQIRPDGCVRLRGVNYR